MRGHGNRLLRALGLRLVVVEETVDRFPDGRVAAVTERLEWQRVRPWWAPWRR